MTAELELTERTEVPRITVEEVKARIDRGEPIFFADTRSEKSWSESDVKIRDAVRIPPDDAAKHLEKVPHDRSIVTYCT